jgi:hypothetical protein
MKNLLAPLLLLPVLSFADPGPATRYLIDESASLMDIGILRAELRLAQSRNSFTKIYEDSSGVKIVSLSTAVIYDYKDDTLNLEIRPLVREPGKAEQGCKDLQTASHGWLRDVIPYLFGHSGYQANNRPDGLAKQIAERTVVYCIAQSYPRRNNIVTVRMYLSSDKISVMRHGVDN